MGVTIDDARAIAATLPRSYEALVRDEVRFRVGRLVYAAFYHDDTIMGFGFPRDEREALVASEPDKFLMPRPPDMRYQWVCVRLEALDEEPCLCDLAPTPESTSRARWSPRRLRTGRRARAGEQSSTSELAECRSALGKRSSPPPATLPHRRHRHVDVGLCGVVMRGRHDDAT